jgi:hypothetical protein
MEVSVKTPLPKKIIDKFYNGFFFYVFMPTYLVYLVDPWAKISSKLQNDSSLGVHFSILL